MTIIVKDLEMNIELDKQAMTSLLGGRKNLATSTSYANLASSGKIRWANTGASLRQHRSVSRDRAKLYKL